MSAAESATPREYTVGLASELPPGERKLVQVRNLEIGVYNVGGTYYALHNMCPHQFGPLCTGPTSGMMVCDESTGWLHEYARDGEIVTCPWHGVEFDVKTGHAISPIEEFRARTFPVRVVDGELRVQVGRVQAAEE